ncbi:MAG: hypothetical protein IPJ77_09535 [Planctomycetes bacterium]|nr:hypothetical protein [Planctomycetota bacterium]
MLRFVLALPLVLPFVIAAPSMQSTAPAGSATQLTPIPGCCNTFLHEPLLVYDVAGSTIAGPTYAHLVVYDDGHAFIAATTAASDPGRAATSVLSRSEVQALKNALVAQGAYAQCDDTQLMSDVPLTTVTVLNGTTNGVARSFSYQQPNASQAGIELRIRDLIAQHFPGY